MNFQHLTTFCTVISEGSMTAAAEKLFLTQPAVSQQIRNLEDELSVELLQRGSRQAKATAQGQILYEYAKRILALSQQAQIAIQTMNVEVEGTFRIGTLNSLGLYIVSPLIGLFLKHNTKLSVHLTYSDGESLIRAFDKGELDIMILPDAGIEYGLEPKGSEKKLLMQDEMWLVGSTKDAQMPEDIELQDLVIKPFVNIMERYPHFENELSKALKSKGVELHPVFETVNVGTLKRVLESGLGWGFLPSHSIRKHVRSGRLTTIPVLDFSYTMNVYYYFHKGSNDENSKRMHEVFYRALLQQVKGKAG
ncbi:MAG: LysR family transcriptional regulator [Bdellovibrionaceae bacterium]|nr:LysR family transcriptional regulator [Pseudobdellovibrionaceae bacterium]